MTEAIFGSSAIVTMLLQERGWQAIRSVLSKPAVDPVLAGLRSPRSAQWLAERATRAALAALGARVEHTNDADLLRAAALIELAESNPGPDGATLSLGDALILAVGDRLGCVVVTRDTYGKWMADEGLVSIKVHVP